MTREQVFELIENHFRANFDKNVERIGRYLNSPHNAEDVIQQAYCNACQYWNTYDEKRDFNTWFYIILSNSIKSFYKADIMHGMAVDSPQDSVDAVEQRIELKELLKLIEEEGENVKRILYLYLSEGYTSDEVSDVVPESASNIRKIVQRFRESLR